MHYKIILIVISSFQDEYPLFFKPWIEYINYIKSHDYPIKVIMCFGKIENTKLENIPEIPSDNLFISGDDECLFPGIFNKTIKCIKYINENYNYNKIIRTNLSSFFHPVNTLKFEVELPNKKLYAGILHGKNDKINHFYVSGACIWLSRDITELLLNKYELITDDKVNNLHDDVYIGLLIKGTNIISEPKIKRHWNNLMPFSVSKKELDNHHHFRLKHKDWRLSRKKDINNFKWLLNQMILY